MKSNSYRLPLFLAAATTALVTSHANAAVIAAFTYSTWQTSANGYWSPTLNYYNDQLLNIAQSGSNVTGGHGWGAFSTSTSNGTSVTADTVSPNTIVATNAGATNLTFNFTQSSGPAGGMYAVGFYFRTSSNAGANAVTATFGTDPATMNGFVAGWNTTGLNFVGFVSDSPVSVLTVTFNFAAGSTIEIESIQYGVVPAPGAAALLGVAGMIGVRRRRTR